jgi:hypothetical protein
MPWARYQTFVTGRAYERVYELNYEQIQVDGGPTNGYLVEAKWVGRNAAAFEKSPYNTASKFYDEEKIADQARRLLVLNKGLNGNGIRYAVSEMGGADAFLQLFQAHFPKQVESGVLGVYHVPGNGM